jgi:hypothetical protein
MIKATVEGSTAVIKGMNELPEDVRKVISEGIDAATKLLQDDIVAHTPRKSGKAADSLQAFFRKSDNGNTQAATIAYDYSATEAFYMRFVLAGALPHKIFPKYGGRGLKQEIKRREKKGLSTEGIVRKRALAFSSDGGEFVRGVVNHPGVATPLRLLTRRLNAREHDMLAEIRERVDRYLYVKELGQKQSQGE